MAEDYRFRDKDPIIDVMRTLIQIRADIEGISFNKVLSEIEKETHNLIKFSTMYGWFMGATKWPQYRMVARVILNLQRYARRPVAIGDRSVRVIGVVTGRRAAHG